LANGPPTGPVEVAAAKSVHPSASFLGRYREIWYSLAAVAVISGLYVLAYRQQGKLPGSSTFAGHGIGIAGFVLMLFAAVGYTIRKRLTNARWGSLQTWLRFHMVAGLVGPFMVFLHTGMRFWGLAGVATLLTLIVVLSGMVGRYVYESVPQSPEGVAATQRRFWSNWRTAHVAITWALVVTALVHMAGALYYELGR
jgi:hypothetical protein